MDTSGTVGGLTSDSLIRLSSNMRVVGLPRKSRNGTRFHVVDSTQVARKRSPAPKGYAKVIHTAKDGTVVAQLESGGTRIMFSTKNKTVWPDGQAGTALKLIKRRRKAEVETKGRS